MCMSIQVKYLVLTLSLTTQLMAPVHSFTKYVVGVEIRKEVFHTTQRKAFLDLQNLCSKDESFCSDRKERKRLQESKVTVVLNINVCSVTENSFIKLMVLDQTWRADVTHPVTFCIFIISYYSHTDTKTNDGLHLLTSDDLRLLGNTCRQSSLASSLAKCHDYICLPLSWCYLLSFLLHSQLHLTPKKSWLASL